MNDWQSWAAPAVVLVTAACFLYSSLKNRKKSGCGGACGCAQKPQALKKHVR
ncbi:FeoB-associated Cys-rich membrane protein [Prosthecobacter dejongeii]|uniref:FeoB-associated Cys-rich membrane protein n=1 Tax=Prosthecobacter dejongeii TaxID=48465 RepID=UPI00161F7B8D